MSSFPPPELERPDPYATDPWASSWGSTGQGERAYPPPPRARRKLAIAGIIALTALALVAATVFATVFALGGFRPESSPPAGARAGAPAPSRTPGSGPASSGGPAGGSGAGSGQQDDAEYANDPIPVPTGTLGDVTTLPRGACFDFPADDAAEEAVLTHACSEPHDAEVYANYELAAGRWPGEVRVEKAAERGCEERFRSYVGRSYEDSALEYSSLGPTKRLWRTGDRHVSCVLEDPADELTGSARRSKR